MAGDAVRLALYVPTEIDQLARAIAKRRGISRNAVFRLALGILQAHETALEAGQYVGTTRIREDLEQVLVAPL
jgi:hypothetical protein